MGILRAGVGRVVASPWLSFALLFLVSFVVRYNRLEQIPSQYLVPTDRWELGSIAISLVKTGQFANPYMIPTGPTAHLPPVYPFIFSMIYRWFGLTAEAGYASMLFIIVAGSLLYALIIAPVFCSMINDHKAQKKNGKKLFQFSTEFTVKYCCSSCISGLL